MMSENISFIEQRVSDAFGEKEMEESSPLPWCLNRFKDSSRNSLERYFYGLWYLRNVPASKIPPAKIRPLIQSCQELLHEAGFLPHGKYQPLFGALHEAELRLQESHRRAWGAFRARRLVQLRGESLGKDFESAQSLFEFGQS